MNDNGFHASMKGGKQIFAIFMIAALMLAALPVASVFAQDGGPTGGDDTGGVSANQMRELQQAQTWFNNFRTRPGQDRSSAKISQYLDQYAFALMQANAILAGGNTNSNAQGNNANGQDNNNNQGNNLGFGSSSQQFAAYLHMMRGLREKIANTRGDGGTNNNNAGNNGVGIPVTGGSTTNNNTGAANDTGTTDNNNQNATQNNSLAQTWGGQWRELQQAQAWYNNFRTKPGQNRNSERISRYLDQYAFALRQANAIIAGGIDANNQGNISNNQDNNTNDQGNNQGQRWGSPQQLLNMYLHWMRGLQVKIANGGPEGGFNNNNSDSNSTGTTSNSGTP